MSYSISPKQKGVFSVEVEDGASLTSSHTPSNIDVEAPTSVPQETAGVTGQDRQEAPISQPDAKQALSDPRLADLERKELALREEARRIKAEKAELESMRASSQVKPGAMTADEWRALFLQDPQKVGIGYQEMADKYLTQPSEQDQKYTALESKIAELQAKLGEGNKVMEEAQKKAYDNAINQMRADTKRVIESSPQDFELISAQGQHDAVVELIEATYREDGILMSPKEAAEKVENYLLDKALKVAGLRKVREKTSPSLAEAANKQTQDQRTTPNTLSQSMQASRPMTPRERAIAAFNRKL